MNGNNGYGSSFPEHAAQYPELGTEVSVPRFLTKGFFACSTGSVPDAGGEEAHSDAGPKRPRLEPQPCSWTAWPRSHNAKSENRIRPRS